MNLIKEVIDRSTLLSIAMISLIVSILSLSIPIAAQTLINFIAFGQLLQPVVTLSLIVFVLMLAVGALNIWQIIIVEVIQQKIMVKTGLELTGQFTHLSLNNFSSHHGPELVNRFFDVAIVKKTLASLLLYGINLVLQVFFGLLLLLIYHPLFIVFDGFIIISVFLIIYFPYQKARDTAEQECAQKHKIGAWLEEILINRFLFRFNRYDKYATRQTDKRLVSFLRVRNQHFKALLRHQIGFYILSAIASALLLGLGGYLVIKMQLSLGQLVAAEIVLGSLIYAFKRFGGLLENYYDLLASQHKIESVLSLPSESITYELDEVFIPIKKVEIILANDLNAVASIQQPLLVHCKETEVGQYFTECLLAFKQGTHFRFLINDTPCNDKHRMTLRQYAMLIGQPQWFAGTIYDNLLLNNHTISNKTIVEQLKRFGLLEKIMQMPDGLKTVIYDWQSLFTDYELIEFMVVRALLFKPQLLIVDRAFDLLDRQNIDFLMKELTALDSTVMILVSQHLAIDYLTNHLVLNS